MIIHVISIMHNEEKLLPYFLRHYSTFADKIFILDDDSTDRTFEIAIAHPKVVLLKFDNPTPGFNNEIWMNEKFIETYKKHSRGVADWVMIADGDEFFYHKNIREVLQSAKDAKMGAVKVTAYSMVSDHFPTTKGQIYEECCYGVRNINHDKTIILDPSLDISFWQGRHNTIVPDGIDRGRIGILFMHFQHLGKEYFLDRYNHAFPRRQYKRANARQRMNKGLDFFNYQLTKII